MMQRLLRSALISGLCFGMLAGATDALAAKKRIVVFARPAKGVANGQALFIQRSLHSALRRRPKLDVPSSNQLTQALYTSTPDPKDPARIATMKKFLAKSKTIYGIKSYSLARRSKYVIGALRKVRTASQEMQSTSQKPKLLEQMYLYYALAFFGLNETDKTRKYVLMLLNLTPTFQLPSGLPRKFVSFYNAAARWLRGQPRYTMKVSSVPIGAKLYHNYRYVGTTPHTLSGLYRGKHRLRLTIIKHKPWERVANLNPTKLKGKTTIPVKIPMQMDPLSKFLVTSPLYSKDANHSDEILDQLDKISLRTRAKFLFFAMPIKAKGNFWVRFALYKNKSRKILYKNVNLGTSSRSIQSKLNAFASSIK